MSTLSLSASDVWASRRPIGRRQQRAQVTYPETPVATVATVTPSATELPLFRRKDLLALGVLSMLAHGVVAWQIIHAPERVVVPTPPAIPPMVVELARPLPQTPVVEPPKPIEPPPKTRTAPVPPQPRALPRPETPVTAAAPTAERVADDTPVVVAAAKPVALPTPAPEEKVTEAVGYAGYLKNPAPEYPAFAMRQGWQGRVLLKVHVLASGKPDAVEIVQTSGRKVLDDAALAAVQNWLFVPSKRGQTAIDGWATVPIEFKLGS